MNCNPDGSQHAVRICRPWQICKFNRGRKTILLQVGWKITAVLMRNAQRITRFTDSACRPILPADPPCMHTCMQELAQRRANCRFKNFQSSHCQGLRDDVIRSAAVCWQPLPCRTRSRCPCDSCRSEALSSCPAAAQAQGGTGSRTAQQAIPSAVCPTGRVSTM